MPDQDNNFFAPRVPQSPITPDDERGLFQPPPDQEPSSDEESPQISTTGAEDGAVEPTEKPKDELADLFEVPQPEDNDMVTDYLFAVEDEDEDLGMDDDLSDLTSVSPEDVMGAPPKPKPKFRRTGKVYRPPGGYPTSLGGMRR